MLRRIAALAAVVFAVAVSAALADNGASPAAGGQGNAPVAAGRGGPAQLEQRLQQLRQRVIAVATAFNRHCVAGHADVAKCTAAANRMVAGLQRVDGRIDTLVGRIQQRCGGGTDGGSQAVPPACARAGKVVQVLQDVQARVRRLEQKLQDWLANPPAGGIGSTDSSGSSSSGDGLEPLGQLAADLAAARAAAAQSGL